MDDGPRDMVPRLVTTALGIFFLWRDDDGWWHWVLLGRETAGFAPRKVSVSAGYPTPEDALQCGLEDSAPVEVG